MRNNIKYMEKEWEVIEKQEVIDKFVAPTYWSSGIKSTKFEYIIRNKITGELRRV